MTDAEMLAEALRRLISSPPIRRTEDWVYARKALAAYDSRKAQGPTLAESHGKPLRPFYCSCVGLDPTCPEHGPNPEPGRFGEGAIAQGMREAMRAEAKPRCPTCRGQKTWLAGNSVWPCPDCRGGK